MIVKNDRIVKILTFRSAIGLTLFPFIFVRKDARQITINHEKIHYKQQIELLVIVFYIWYLIEWIFKGYKGISFEKEANANEENNNYIEYRKCYSFLKY